MMRKFILILILGACSLYTYSQGMLRGRISDENGDPIVGATIFLKESPTNGTISDLDGNYSLKISCYLSVTVVRSDISYENS